MASVRSNRARSLTLGATLLTAAALALAGCSNTGSAAAPTTSATAPPAPPSAAQSAAPAQPGQGVPASPPPGNGAVPAPQGQPAPSQPPLNTTLYPPPDVPRTSAGNAKEMAYLQSLQKGGLALTASGTTELNLGHSICSELARGSTVEDMKKLLVPVAAMGASLGQSKLTGEQAADLYLASAKANLC